MTRLLALLLPVCLLFSTAGFVLLLQLQRYQVRQEVKARITAGLPDHELVLLKISQEQESGAGFERLDAQEFRYRGRLYDVVRQETHAGSTWYYCLEDAEETRLYAELEEQTEEELERTGTRQKQRVLLLKLLSSLYFSESRYCWQPAAAALAAFPLSADALLLSRQAAPPSPPPQG